MLHDIKFALRMLGKAPGFTAVALLTLALGIGANTAIFTLVDAALLRPLPVSHPGQLALLTDPSSVGTNFGLSGGRRGLLAYPEYVALRGHNEVFSGLLAAESGMQRDEVSWGHGGGERAWTKLVSGNYFSVLGVDASRGRTFAPAAADKIDGDPVAVMSYAYWNHRFARSPGVIGSQFRLRGHAFTVIGIAPPGFFGETVGQAPELWMPITMAPEARPGQDMLHNPPGVTRLMWLQVMGRMKPGVTLAQAQAASNIVFQQLVKQQAAAAPDAQGRQDVLSQRLQLSSGAQGASGVRGDFAEPLWALFALVGVVLVLAIINLASLLLARATARQKEAGVRLALGAGRGRIVRQLLTESVLLSVIGGLLGVALAVWGVRLLLGLVAAGGDTVALSLAPDWRVLGFVAALCVLSGVLFGLAPALRMARLDLNTTLQAQGRGGAGRTRHVLGGLIRGGLPLGKVLVIGQVALAIVLLVGAGLFVRSLQKLQQVPLGFQAQNLTEFGMDAGSAGYKNQAGAAYFHRVLERLQSLPGVQGAALSMDGLFAHSDSGLPIAVAGYTPPGGLRSTDVRFDGVSAGYFKTVGMPILLGRGFTAADDTSGVNYAVINQTLQKKLFAGRNPLGQQLRDLYPDDHNATFTVIGVVADAKTNGLSGQTPPRFYLDYFNHVPGADMSSAKVFVRGAGGAGALNASVHQAVTGLDASVPLDSLKNVTAMVGESLASQQLLAKLSSFFGILALLVAAIGLYGVMAYGVARRTPEIGVRLALGASRRDVTGMILAETMVLVAAGLALGLPASIGGAKLVASQMQLFGLSYVDPASLLGATLVLAAAACLAGYLPARRAAGVDPLQALRAD